MKDDQDDKDFMVAEADEYEARVESAVLAVARTLLSKEVYESELWANSAVQALEYFTPDEDGSIRLRYFQYLEVRAVLSVTSWWLVSCRALCVRLFMMMP